MDPRRDETEHPRRNKGAPRIEVVAAPVAPPTSPAETAEPSRPASRRRAIALAAALIVGAGAVVYWLDARRFEETDDAQIDGDISNLSPRIAGTVKAVYVSENQIVHKGQLLAELDPADMQAALAEARAAVDAAEAQLRAEDPTVSITATSNRAAIASSASDLASARAAVAEAQKAVEQINSQLAEAQANDGTAQLERHRAEILLKNEAIPQAELDRRLNAALASTANVEALRHALGAARERVQALAARVTSSESHAVEVRSNAPREIEARRASVAGRQAALALARARLTQAELNLSYTKIASPTDGIVGKKAITADDRVSPGQTIIAVADLGHLWVTANFRETQLRRIQPGQPADVYVDGLATSLHGTVESLGGATGSRYSVFPPENATGNYVKVVQRLPVRLRLDDGQPGLERLRPGLSVEPKVRVR